MTTVHYQIPPRPTLNAHRAMKDMGQALQHVGLTPDPRPADWSVDARLYRPRDWERTPAVGHGSPIAALCLRLHQGERDRLWWVYETPVRGVRQWATPDPVPCARSLHFLVDAGQDLDPADLAPIRQLLHEQVVSQC